MKNIVIIVLCMLMAVSSLAFETVTYDDGNGEFGVGDLFLPTAINETTPVFLSFHDDESPDRSRQELRGVAQFLATNGCVVYNIDYRPASKAASWSDCRKDCLNAANFALGGGLARFNVRPKSIYLIGTSSGGHLAVWVGLTLPPQQVAGIVDISGRVELDAVNVVKLVRAGCPRLLITHAREDRVVPFAGSSDLAVAYSAVGGVVDYVQYSVKDEPNLGGHCIWRPGKDMVLVDRIEQSILRFLGRTGVDVIDYQGEDYARSMASDGWRVAYLNNGPKFGKVTYQERHFKSDEIFVLLEGEATLVLDDDHHRLPLKPGVVYNVRRGTWHQIETTGKVLVFENNDTSSNNSETRPL